MDASWINFLGLLLFGSIVLGSVVWFFPSADMDFRIHYDGQTENFREAGVTRHYDGLTDHQQQIFHETLQNERYVTEEPIAFPESVKKNGTYYQFSTSKAYDWANPSTHRPAIVWLVGLVGVIMVLRRDIRGHP